MAGPLPKAPIGAPLGDTDAGDVFCTRVALSADDKAPAMGAVYMY